MLEALVNSTTTSAPLFPINAQQDKAGLQILARCHKLGQKDLEFQAFQQCYSTATPSYSADALGHSTEASGYSIDSLGCSMFCDAVERMGCLGG